MEYLNKGENTAPKSESVTESCQRTLRLILEPNLQEMSFIRSILTSRCLGERSPQSAGRWAALRRSLAQVAPLPLVRSRRRPLRRRLHMPRLRRRPQRLLESEAEMPLVGNQSEERRERSPNLLLYPVKNAAADGALRPPLAAAKQVEELRLI